MSPPGELRVYRLGRVEYEDGLELQKRFGQWRAEGRVPDVLLLLEHPPVLTLGRAGKSQHIVAPPEVLARMGIPVFETNRGGDVTYHGPGQVVGYPILQLEGKRQDVRRYVRDVEEAMIRAAGAFGVEAGRIPKWTGVWVGEAASARKLGAIGVHLSRWRTSHGFAFNANTDLSHFRLIVPCGIEEAGVTSLQRELGRPVDLSQVESALAEAFAESFGAARTEGPDPVRTISVVVVRTDQGSPEVLLLRRTADRGGFWQPVTGRVEPGESADEAAARELSEETGAALPVASLGYAHAFAWKDEVARETAFAARWARAQAPVRVDPKEHDAFEWLPPAEAIARVPFAGLKEAIRRAVR